MAELRMPSLGADMESGTLVEWHVKPGDHVRRGDVVAVVETEKGLIEVEIWHAGTVVALQVEPGRKVPVGTTLAIVRTDVDTPAPAAPAPAPTAPPAHVEAPSAPRAPPGAAAPERPRASPAARQRARDLDVALTGLQGTGPHGTVSLADVERAARPSPPAAPTPDEAAVEEARRAAMRRSIAAAMTRSKREIPHYYLATDIDMSRALGWLARRNLELSVAERILPAALLCRAVALALRLVPELNGHFIDGAHRPSEVVHLGVAISLRRGGLVAPAIHDADTRSLGELMRALADLTTRARAGKLKSSELSDPTVTVTNLGERGVETVHPIIHPPQVAMVGFGRITERPWAEAGMLGVRPVLTATLAADHRVSDGHRGAQFLRALAHHLDAPEAR